MAQLPLPQLSLPPPSLQPNACFLFSTSQALLSSACFKPNLTSRRLASLHRLPRLGGGVCAAHSAGNEVSSDDSSASSSKELSSFDRRQLLLGSSSLSIAGLPSLLRPYRALSSPVQPPDLAECTTPIDPGNGAASVDCCLPVSETITDFTLPTNLPLRTRVHAHQASADYIAKYKEAYRLLRELPASDPRTYTLQANVHCAFCDGAYVADGTELEYQVHSSWLFMPWHRWYLYFHERILASLINDDTFALPFWNWDAESGYTIPPIFADSDSPLYSSNRNSAHVPPTVVDLNYDFTESGLSPAEQLAANNKVMYTQIVAAKIPRLFFGEPYRQGDDPNPGAGTLENSPHGTVHIWTGSPDNPNGEDMGSLYSAARDPIFFAHHSNVDRLWEVWKTLGPRRQDISDSDYLNATFLFYDENSKLVRVSVKDSLDPSKLAYEYQDVPNAWIQRVSTSSSTATAMASFGPAGGPHPAMAGHIRQKIKEKVKNFKANLKEFKEKGPRKVEKPISVLVKRPKKVKADDDEEEILVLEGVEIGTDEKIKFDVYINLVEGAEKVGCDVSEYAGSFVNVPHHKGMKMGDEKRVRKSNFRIGVGEVLKELDIEDDDDFAITIVPRGNPNVPISVQSVKLEYE